MDGQKVMLLSGFLCLFFVNNTISDCPKKIFLSWEQHDDSILVKCKYCEILHTIILDSPFYKRLANCNIKNFQENRTKHVVCDVVKRYEHNYKVKVNNIQKDIVLSSLHKTALENVNGAWTCRHGTHGESSKVVIKVFSSEDDCLVEAIFAGLTGFGIVTTIALIMGKFGCGLRKRCTSCCECKPGCGLRKKCHSCSKGLQEYRECTRCDLVKGLQEYRECSRCDLVKENVKPCLILVIGVSGVGLLGGFVTEKLCISAICGSLPLGILCGISFLVILTYCKKDKRAQAERDQLPTSSTSGNDDPDEAATSLTRGNIAHTPGETATAAPNCSTAQRHETTEV